MDFDYSKSKYLEYIGKDILNIEKEVTELAAHLTMVKYTSEDDYREKVTQRTFEAFDKVKELKKNYEFLEEFMTFIDNAEFDSY